MSFRPAELSPRDRILKTAWRLFYENGFRAIGIDRIIAEADVAKQSFYNHFASKDELIVALLEQAAVQSAKWEAAAISGRPDPLVALVEAAVRRAGESSCFGCPFQIGASEFPDPTNIVYQAARQAKDATLHRYKAYASQQNLVDPERAASDIFLLMEGIWIAVRIFGRDAPVGHAAETARKLTER
ncbi:TetR/AcrR family transcriptional regulator [Tabrizicola sp.]|uniref:TetR/AcrR family transcriptional regulator n=1 Tax=Tabrizicola sp. TaxID=2005166 RepID=UPI003F4179BF